jgi:hypothetical protein
MYIYNGKITWQSYAENETITIVFPSGFNKGDPVAAFWRWTADKDENKNVNQSYIGKISSATPADKKLVLFDTSVNFYRFDADLSSDNEKLTITMTNKNGTTAEATSLQQVLLDTIDLSPKIGVTVYTGKYNYHGYADDELFTLIVPASSAFSIPIIATWQWTKDKDGNKNTTRCVAQDAADSIVGSEIKFFQDQYYSFKGKVVKEGKEVEIKMKGKDGLGEVEFVLGLAYTHS